MRILEDGKIQDDAWQTIRDPQEEKWDAGNPPQGAWLLPCPFWLEHQDTLKTQDIQTGVWLDGDAELEDIAEQILALPLIAVDFPVFTDGRCYSLARLLRERYGYTGKIRAIGNVLRDQLFYMMRCGINSFAVQQDMDEAAFLQAFQELSVRYQAACDEKLPLYRRR